MKIKYEKPKNPNSRYRKLQTRVSEEQEKIIRQKAARAGLYNRDGEPNVALYLMIAGVNYEPRK